ncbi:7-keto-8-aminopelargonate synthetase-like enzyme [Flavobacterium sp. PL11]|uniref:aminotransferase class I/II-fold pyridoxal phosphate-dependent enzyme n=1 Tax=Flavobacterium sp. PL11 TaxID=3071717 RepID=UPI002DF889F2|nr:7-keto-8-aminopelargonate synthetase-like enzyme [Flavobacterium sp. PL11]
MQVEQFPDREIQVGGKLYRYFGGTAYLGLPTHPQFQELLIKNIIRWGTAYGSSRNSNIKLSAYDNAELFLASFIKAKAALTVSSGMLAAKLVLEELSHNNNCFYHFPNIHAALKIVNSQPFYIDNQLNPCLLNNITEKITILVDSVPTFQTKPIDFSILEMISKSKEITLVIDESHSLGLLGINGCGLYSNISLLYIKRKIMIASLGKAFGLTGGVIASDIEFINKIKNLDTFISSAGINAAFAQTIAEAGSIYSEQHKRLKENLIYLGSKLSKNKAIQFDMGYPLIYPKTKGINEILLANDIIITNFKYPLLDQELNRIVITANHLKQDLDALILILNHHQM